uniref:Uncharacterized protein n=1 Tax=Rhizophora mucronata TaxID=61149 RepID=A0A2P2NNX5_RHIMU
MCQKAAMPAQHSLNMHFIKLQMLLGTFWTSLMRSNMDSGHGFTLENEIMDSVSQNRLLLELRPSEASHGYVFLHT